MAGDSAFVLLLCRSTAVALPRRPLCGGATLSGRAGETLQEAFPSTDERSECGRLAEHDSSE